MARRVKSLSQNGAKNRKHREHRSDKTRSNGFALSKETKVRKLIKRQSFEAEEKRKLRDFKREYNENLVFRKIKANEAEKIKNENNN